jgi:glycosyltransferase involved in cell wall biosynthesis
MYKGKSVAVVIPAHNEEKLIGRVIETMPVYVDKIVVVNDKSPDNTAQIVRGYVEKDPDKVVLIDLDENQGVGGAIAQGYKWARDNEIDLTAVMAGDAQMDPNNLSELLDPVAEGKVDYAKGNRLFYGQAWQMIPKVRYLGNSALSFMTKIASGYWHVADSQSGFTVASLEVLQTINLDKIYKRYGMPNDVLVKLNVYNFRVGDIHIKPVYNVGEKSGIKIYKVLVTIPILLFRLFFHRMIQKYVIRDFHPLIMFYFFGTLSFFPGCYLALKLLWIRLGGGHFTPASATLAALLVIGGLQLLLFAMLFDMESNKELKGE